MYKLVWNEDQVIKFGKMFLSDLQIHNRSKLLKQSHVDTIENKKIVKHICLAARHKFNSENKEYSQKGSTNLNQVILKTNCPYNFLNEIKQYEVKKDL